MKIKFTKTVVLNGKLFNKDQVIDSKEIDNHVALLKSGICKRTNVRGVGQ